MDPFARLPDIAIYVMDGGYVVKDCAVSMLDMDDDAPAFLSVNVSEHVTTLKDNLLSLVSRLVDDATARKRALDEEDGANEDDDLGMK